VVVQASVEMAPRAIVVGLAVKVRIVGAEPLDVAIGVETAEPQPARAISRSSDAERFNRSRMPVHEEIVDPMYSPVSAVSAQLFLRRTNRVQ
jgi:hypothetical protein